MVNDGNHLPHHHGFQFVGASLPFTFHWRCDPKKVVELVGLYAHNLYSM